MVVSNPPLSKDRPIWETVEFHKLESCYQEAVRGLDFRKGIFETQSDTPYSLPNTLSRIADCEEEIAELRHNRNRIDKNKKDALEGSNTSRFTTLHRSVGSIDDILAELSAKRSQLLRNTEELLLETQKPLLKTTNTTLTRENIATLYEIAQKCEKKYAHPALAALFYIKTTQALLKQAPEINGQRIAALVEQMEDEPYIALATFDAQLAHLQAEALARTLNNYQEAEGKKAVFNTITKQHENLNTALKGFSDLLQPQSISGRIRERIDETLVTQMGKRPLAYALRAASKAIVCSSKDALSGREAYTALELLSELLYWPIHGEDPRKNQVIEGLYKRREFRGMEVKDLISIDQKHQIIGKISEEEKPALRALYYTDLLKRPLDTQETYFATAGLACAQYASGQKDAARSTFEGPLATAFNALRKQDETYKNKYHCMSLINGSLNKLPADLQREFYQKHGLGITLPV